MEPVELRTERLVLGQPRASDVDAITASLQDPLIERFLSVPWPYERAHAVDFVTGLVPSGWARGTEASWAIRLGADGPLIGMVSLRLQKHDVGFWTGAEHRGLGYMPEAVSRVADWAFEQGETPIARVLWESVAGNVGSARVARKAGFRFAGTGPSTLPARDGSHPASWFGTLSPEVRSVHVGWPAEVAV